MYVNLKTLTKKLKRGDLELLIGIKQNDVEYLIEELDEDDLRRFESLNFISRVKMKKKDDHPYQCLRLSPDAKKFLIDLSYEGSADEESKTITDWLIKVYKNKSGGIVKNKTETLRRLHWFKTITDIRGNKLAVLLQLFMQDTYDPSEGESVKDFMDRNPRGVLSNMVDVICWKPESMYDKHYTLDKSPLWAYYEDNQEYVEKWWKAKKLIEE